MNRLAVLVIVGAVTSGCRDVSSLLPNGGRGAGVEANDASLDAYQSPRRDSAVSTDPTITDAASADAAPKDGSGVDEVACNACEAANCRDVDDLDLYAMCFLATDTASQGPGAGTPKSELCKAVLQCARATGCAAVDPQPCYCGDGVTDLQCLAGNASGPCKTVIEVAAESSSSSVIADRLADPSYASGAAFNLLRYCERPICGAACAGGGMSSDAGVPADASILVDAPKPPDAAPPPDAPIATCADLDSDGKPDCTETRVQNARFDSGVTAWVAELGVTQSWDGTRDGLAAPASGSMVVTNGNVVANSGVTMAGSAQCIPAATGAFTAAAQLFIPGMQSSGSAGLSIHFFAAAGCAGSITGVWTSPTATTAGTWTTIAGTPVAPSTAQSMRVRLVVVKPFSAPAFRAQFDNILIEQP